MLHDAPGGLELTGELGRVAKGRMRFGGLMGGGGVCPGDAEAKGVGGAKTRSNGEPKAGSVAAREVGRWHKGLLRLGENGSS